MQNKQKILKFGWVKLQINMPAETKQFSCFW